MGNHTRINNYPSIVFSKKCCQWVYVCECIRVSEWVCVRERNTHTQRDTHRERYIVFEYLCVGIQACELANRGRLMSCAVTLNLIHLRQGLSANLKLSWLPTNPRNPLVSTSSPHHGAGLQIIPNMWTQNPNLDPRACPANALTHQAITPTSCLFPDIFIHLETACYVV